MDETDFRILRFLMLDGRASFVRLGDEVGLSAHGAADRVRRLRKSGVITGFTAAIALDRLGRGLDACIDVRLLASTDPDEFERRVLAMPAIRELASVTGRFDYELRVACTDAEELDQTVRALRRDAGAASTETRLVMRAARPLDSGLALAER